MGQLFLEADARGEPGDDVFALAVVTDGHDISFLRVSLGAPADRVYGPDSTPFLSLMTKAMPLLRGWNFRDPKFMIPTVPPAGFEALVSVLRAPTAVLAPRGRCIPLRTLDAMVTLTATTTPASKPASAPAPAPAPVSELTPVSKPTQISFLFSARLSCGGTSDVYKIEAAAASPFVGACVKVPSFANAQVDAQFRNEARALREFGLFEAEDASMPRLLGEGERASASSEVQHRQDVRSERSRWPLLVLKPAGTLLVQYLDRCLDVTRGVPFTGVGTAATSSISSHTTPQSGEEIRRSLADCAARSLLRTQKVAHERKLMHCDVRPANLIVLDIGQGAGAAPPRILLADWGLCAETLRGEDWRRTRQAPCFRSGQGRDFVQRPAAKPATEAFPLVWS